jgi:hypothetical protein
MTAAEIIERVHISQVAEALGIPLDRTRRRGVATWRNGKKFSVSFSDAKGVFHDFVTNEGGGVLDLVSRVVGCDRRKALQWLAAYAGVLLTELTNAGWRDMRATEPEARELVAWKLESLESLRRKRNLLQRIYHNAVRFVLSHDFDECEASGDLRFEVAVGIGETYWLRV